MVQYQEEIPRFTRDVLAETFLRLEGKDFSLENYPFYREIYQVDWSQILFKCGRQVAKSTTLNNRSVTNSIATPHFRTLYLAPTQNQAHVYSTSRVDPALKYSPRVYDSYLARGSILNMGHKRFRNGSEIRIMYASDNADRIRGISADEVDYDEVQDIVLKSVVPVVNECMAASNYRYQVYAGTPKSMDNGIEALWQRSSQHEWVIKCTGCNTWNLPISEDSIGLKGVICVKCGKGLRVRDGRWVAYNPDAKMRGYHISQLIMPLNSEDPLRWEDILNKHQTYPESKFKNEVIGISDMFGTRLVGQVDLEEGCRDYLLRRYPREEDFEGVLYTIAGVDWSGGGSAQFTSRSSVWIWGVLPDGRLKTMYYKIYPTANPFTDAKDIAEVCHHWRVRKVAGDAGMGAIANAILASKLGYDRVMQMQYASSSHMLRWNSVDRYMLDKTSAIDTVMMLIKDNRMIFGNKTQMQPAFDDILAEFEHVTKQGAGKKIWMSNPLVPDDALHAAVFGWAAWQIEQGFVDFYPMNQTPDED